VKIVLWGGRPRPRPTSSSACSKAGRGRPARVRRPAPRFCLAIGVLLAINVTVAAAPPRRLVLLEVDGLNQDLLESAMKRIDPATGKSQLPWLSYIFGENGTIFENFYTRGISLSAPSWSLLVTGRHSVIRGNVEYDRYTGQVYDYLNFFPFYLGYARQKRVDMPGVEVLDRAGISLLMDRFPPGQTLQSFQLFQRGVRWSTLKHALARRFSAESIVSMVESGDAPSYDSVLAKAQEAELERSLENPELFYFDFFTGDLDHEAHATSDPKALASVLRGIDALAGRLWHAIQQSLLSRETLFVMVSDHGMNNTPGVISQTFSLPDLLNSPDGGSHHVVTNRHQMSDFKLRGLDPMVRRVISPSATSFYLANQASQYPTAWLDIDGNERVAVHLRNNDLNKLHILLLALERTDLDARTRRAAAIAVREIIERHRAAWTKTIAEMTAELDAPSGPPPAGDLRQRLELSDRQAERSAYHEYLARLEALLRLQPDEQHPLKERVASLIPQMSLGDNNSAAEIEHYVAGPAATGLVIDAAGRLDEERSFRFVNYPALLVSQRVRNMPQKALDSRPVDFVAMRLPDQSAQHIYELYGDADRRLLIRTDAANRIALEPAGGSWRAGLPLQLFEDPELRLPAGADRAAWLSAWHNEREWFEATHECRYSNGVIGIIEDLSPIEDNVPGRPGTTPLALLYEKRRRALVQADFHVFAADHWNFNVRFPNPGGNHGSFLRISTHSVWMMAGAGLPGRRIAEPYDSLNFAPTLLHLLDRPAPAERVVDLTRNSLSNESKRH
jgi:Type I phosphodiesterase / nucleotide pyrophosphatase